MNIGSKWNSFCLCLTLTIFMVKVWPGATAWGDRPDKVHLTSVHAHSVIMSIWYLVICKHIQQTCLFHWFYFLVQTSAPDIVVFCRKKFCANWLLWYTWYPNKNAWWCHVYCGGIKRGHHTCRKLFMMQKQSIGIDHCTDVTMQYWYVRNADRWFLLYAHSCSMWP